MSVAASSPAELTASRNSGKMIAGTKAAGWRIERRNDRRATS